MQMVASIVSDPTDLLKARARLDSKSECLWILKSDNKPFVYYPFHPISPFLYYRVSILASELAVVEVSSRFLALYPHRVQG